MTGSTSDGVDIASRIKKFSAEENSDDNLDRNGNVTHLKSNPSPKRRYRTQEVDFIKTPISVTRSTSNPTKKPVIPAKPPLLVRSPKSSSTIAPVVNKETYAPLSSKAPEKLQSKSGVKTCNDDNSKINKDINFSNPSAIACSFQNNKTPGKKPPLTQKPAISARPSNEVQGSKLSNSHVTSSNQTTECLKKENRPVKNSVLVAPTANTNTVIPNPKEKPPRGRERSLYAYENHEITVNNDVREMDSAMNKRCDTLDGLILSGSPKWARSKERSDTGSPHQLVTHQQSAPVDFKQSPNRPNYISSRHRSDSALAEAENEYDSPTEDRHSNHDWSSGTHDVENLYDTADPELAQGYPQTLHHSDGDVYDAPDDVYDAPDEWSDYELPPDAKPGANEGSDDDTGDEDYDFPDSGPPPVPRHKSSSEQPPPVPGHQNITENNLQSSSSDEDVCPDYTDPEHFLSKPPVPIYQSSGTIQRNTRSSVRNNVHYLPAEYMPVSAMVPSIDDEDEMMNSTNYIDPATACPTFPILELNSVKKQGRQEEIYSDEPLYQVYSSEVNQQFHRESKKKDGETDDENSSLDLLQGKTSFRMLWSELPSVRTSGTLESISQEERKRQEAMFEVITSEASYLKSLDILVKHFMLNRSFLPNPKMPSLNTEESQILDRQQYHFLFTGLSAIKSVSERFLKDLRIRQQQSIMITSISDIIQQYADTQFQCYVKYCANQVFQDRTLSALMHSSPEFIEILAKLESHRICQGLSMNSFLTLPMQRITRLPLLVDAICSRCTPGSEEYFKTDKALKAINCLVRAANEGARKMERTEEMYFIQKTLTFKTKPIPLISASRWLVKKGDVMCLHDEGRFSKYKTQLRQIFKGKCKPIYLFLFTDLVLVTKMKTENQFKVIDQCQRSLLKAEVLPNIPDPEPPKVGTLATMNLNPLKYAFTLILLENANGKTVDYHFFLPTETQKTRWLEAFNPPKTNAEIEGEAIYQEWDCPQVQAIHSYQAEQSDELTLIEGDVISVLRKLPDGWAEGMRLRDDEKGWFPINHTDEIDSKHIRAKNLMQRYRLVTANKHIIKEIIGK